MISRIVNFASGPFQAVLGLLILLVMWFGLTFFNMVPSFFLASPNETWTTFRQLASEPNYWIDVGVSIARIFAGFLLSVVVALPLGALAVLSPAASRFLLPPVSFIRYLPVPALVPFLILWFGVDEGEKIAVVFVGVFFQMVLMVIDALKSTPEEFRDVARGFGASDWRTFATVTIPNALPQLFDAGRTTLAWAWGWLMLAEVVGSDSGVGHMIIRAQRYLLNAEMIVGLLTIGILGLATDAVMNVGRRRLFRWAG